MQRAQMYADWNRDSEILKGHHRRCDLTWLQLAIQANAGYEAFDLKYATVTLGSFQSAILDVWYHDTPILRMTQRELVNSLFGMEWYLLCGLHDTNEHRGTLTWLEQVTEIIEIIRQRAYFLARHELPTTILDVEEYTIPDSTQRKWNGVIVAQPTNDKDYDSASEDEDEKKDKVAPPKRTRRDMMEEAERGIQLAGLMGKTVRKTRVSLIYIFDVNTMLHGIDLELERYRLEYLNIPRTVTHPALWKMRRVLFETNQESEHVIRNRNIWQYNILALTSQRLIHCRRVKRPSSDVTNEEILHAKLNGYLTGPTNMKEMLYAPIGVDAKQWLRVNSDALFSLMSKQSADGDIYDFLVKAEEEASFSEPPFIYRIRILGQWCLCDRIQGKTIHKSFLAAFATLRSLMRMRMDNPVVRVKIGHSIPPRIRTINLNQYDEMF